MQGKGTIFGLGISALVILGVAGLLQHRLDRRECIVAVSELPAYSQGKVIPGVTVGEHLAKAHPGGRWHPVPAAEGREAHFEPSDGPTYRWRCTREPVPFVQALNLEAESLTPFNLPVERLLERAREGQRKQ